MTHPRDESQVVSITWEYPYVAVLFKDGLVMRTHWRRLQNVIGAQRCAHCGENWPCSDSQRHDIRPELRAQHSIARD